MGKKQPIFTDFTNSKHLKISELQTHVRPGSITFNTNGVSSKLMKLSANLKEGHLERKFVMALLH